MESWELPELYVREEEMNLPEDIETGRGKRQPKVFFFLKKKEIIKQITHKIK